jgi:recombination protein RecA
MPSAHALRIQIEHALERRFPAALSPAPHAAYETAPTGIPEIDDLLCGGFPIGAICELTGAECSGRTSLAHAFLARCTQQGRVCAWVDAEDTFDPESAAAGGLLLDRLLWVRCTDTAPSSSRNRTDHNLPKRKDAPWARLDQALRATDLLLQAGGFSAIVLDLAGVAPEHARRIPLATWFRFRQAAGRTQCSLVVLARESCAQSSAGLVLECASLHAGAPDESVLRGFNYEVRRLRGASAPSAPYAAARRKPPASTWSAAGAWDAEPPAIARRA